MSTKSTCRKAFELWRDTIAHRGDLAREDDFVAGWNAALLFVEAGVRRADAERNAALNEADDARAEARSAKYHDR